MTRNVGLGFLFALGIILLDQATKAFFPVQQLNQQAVFGVVLSGNRLWLLMVSGFIFLFWSWRQSKSLLWQLSHGALVGAGLSNIIDRFWWGGVRDIWTVPWLEVSNNFADWTIFIAAVLVMWYGIRQERSQKRQNRNQDDAATKYSHSS